MDKGKNKNNNSEIVICKNSQWGDRHNPIGRQTWHNNGEPQYKW